MVTERNDEYGTKLWPHGVGYVTELVVWSEDANTLLGDEDY